MMTAFLKGKKEAVTATDEGKVVVWGESLIYEESMRPEKLTGIKIVQIGPEAPKGKNGEPEAIPETTISVLITHGNDIIAGFGDGSIKTYNSDLKVKMWFEDFKEMKSQIKSISFSLLEPEVAANSYLEKDQNMAMEETCPDFLISDNSGCIRRIKAEMHDLPKDDREEPEVLYGGYSEPIVCIAAHPKQPVIAIGVQNGLIQYWHYEKKLIIQTDSVGTKGQPWVMLCDEFFGD